MSKAKYSTNPTEWVDKYSDPLFKYAVVRINDSEIAKDLVQDTFLSALKNSANFRGEMSEKNWLYLILKNKIIDHYRSKARSLTSSINAHLEKNFDHFDENGSWMKNTAPKEWSINYTQTIETKEFNQAIENCKNKLKELQNLVFTMKYIDDFNSDKICKELNITSSNYWVLVHRAKLQMRACIEKNWFNK